MLMDAQLLLSDKQAVTATANSTNIYKLDALASMLKEGRGEPMELLFQVTTAFTAAGAATMSLALTTGNTSALASPQPHFTTGALGKAEFVIGRKWRFPLQLLTADADATHFGIVYTVATGPMTAGNIMARIQPAGADQYSFGSVY